MTGKMHGPRVLSGRAILISVAVAAALPLVAAAANTDTYVGANNQDWNTADSLIELSGSGPHRFSVTGGNRGPSTAGYLNNFAIGTLRLDAGGSMSIAPAASDSALYVNGLDLAGGLDQIPAIDGNGATIYYDPSNPINAYLSEKTYELTG